MTRADRQWRHASAWQLCRSGWCQTDANAPQFSCVSNQLGSTKAAPPCERGGAIGFEILSAREAPLLVEMGVDRGVDSCELLYCSHSPKAEHRPFAPSEWLV
jgi:hypothetical protein